MFLLPALIFQSHWVYSSPLKEHVCKSCRVFKAVHLMQVKSVLCIQHREQRALERVKLNLLWEPLLGTAEGLAEAPNTAFTSTDQEPFELCPEFRMSFSSLPSPPHHLKPCLNAECPQCPRASKTSGGSFGSAKAVLTCLWKHLNFWLPSSEFLQMADILLQST